MTCPLCNSASQTNCGEKNGFAIVSCDGCGLMYASPMPTVEELERIYANYGVNKKNIVRSQQKVGRWKRRLFLVDLFSTRGRFLDIGCNTGFAAAAASEYGYDAYGIDLGEESIAIAKQMFPQCHFFLATAQDYAAQGGQYDLVTCSEVVEHLTELHTFVGALKQLVRPGGTLYLTTPDVKHWMVPNDRLSWDEISPPHHLIYFGKQQISKLLNDNGFRVLFFVPMLHKPNLRVIARRQ
jgi:2-polyprenyl-3-methyl-5-hydroxy-6-metoxy-1,4-benzoquinol methylase